MGPYRVFYLNQFLAAFTTREAALHFRMYDANKRGVSMDNYEILDRSDA